MNVRTRWIRGHLMFCVLMGLTGLTLGCRSRVPIEAFWGLQPEVLRTVQVKLSYLGSQTEPISTVVFVAEGQRADVSQFIPFRRIGIDYTNDEGGWIHPVHVPVTALSTLLESLKQPPHPALTAGGAVDVPFLSFALYAAGASGGQVYEAILDHEQTTTLYGVLQRAFDGCRAAQFTLQGWGCTLGLLPPGYAVDVTEAVDITVSPFTPDPATGRYAGQVMLKNVSVQVLPAPVSVVLELNPWGVELVDPDGMTCHVEPTGRAFVHAPLAADGLAPGASVEIPVVVENAEQETVVFTVKVVAGPQSR